MYCHKCGTKIEEDSAFCTKCGIKLINGSEKKENLKHNKEEEHKEIIREKVIIHKKSGGGWLTFFIILIVIGVIAAIFISNEGGFDSTVTVDPCKREYNSCVDRCGEGVLSGICKEKCSYDYRRC